MAHDDQGNGDQGNGDRGNGDRGTRDLQEIRALLPLYVGGDVADAEARRVREALARSAALRAELEALRAARAALSAHPAPGPPEPLDLWPAIRAQLASEGRLAASGPRPLPPALAAGESAVERRVVPEVAAPSAERRGGKRRGGGRPSLRLWTAGVGLAAAAGLATVLLRPEVGPGPAGPGPQRAGTPLVAADVTPPGAGTSSDPAGALAARPVSGPAEEGLQPVFAGDPSLRDSLEQVAPVWIRRPPSDGSKHSLAGYR